MKKFLSLVLALVMTMSLVTISAGAKDFTDADKVNYDEAIAVLSAVKVIDGYTDGSFKPQTQLNRGQAAKIICNLVLGPTTAAELSATVAPFSDVPANNIFAGYITYCANEGIICGYGDGTFRPTGSLTGYAFMKMLLGALGYDADIEGYNNPGSFGIQVAKQAIGIGLNKGLKDTFDGNKTVTREEACLYALNTLKATMVEYDSKITANVNGAQITVGTSVAQDVKWGVATLNDGNIKDDGFVQFAEKYFPKLELETGNGIYGRPTNVWKLKKAEIGAFTSIEPTVVYTEDTDEDDIYKDLGKVICDTKEYDWTAFVNGKEESVKDLKVPEKGEGSYKYTGEGTVTEIYVDDDADTVTVCEINYYLGQVSKVKKDDDGEYINVKVLSDEAKTLDDKTFYVEGYEEDDYVVFTMDYVEDDKDFVIGEVCEPETATGAVTRVDFDKKNSTITGSTENNTYLKMDGDKYVYADEGHMVYNVEDLTEKKHPTLNDEYLLFMDPNGYVLGFKLTEETIDQYLFVKDSDEELGDWQAKVYLADATAPKIDLKDELDGTLPSGELTVPYLNAKVDFSSTKDDITWVDDNGDKTTDYKTRSNIDGMIWKYTVNKSGVYKLSYVEVFDSITKNITGTAQAKGNTQWYIKGAEIENGEAYVTYKDAQGVSKNGFIVDKNTVFVDVKGEKVYTGYKEVPNVEDAELAYVLDGKVAEVVFILSGDIYDEGNLYFIIADNEKRSSFEYDGDDYWTYEKVYVNGNKTELNIRYKADGTSKVLEEGELYHVLKTVDEDYITKVEKITKPTTDNVWAVGDEAFWLVGTGVNPEKWTCDDETVFVVVDTTADGKLKIYDGDVKDLIATDKLNADPEKADYSACKVDVLEWDGSKAELVYIWRTEVGASNKDDKTGKYEISYWQDSSSGNVCFGFLTYDKDGNVKSMTAREVRDLGLTADDITITINDKKYVGKSIVEYKTTTLDGKQLPYIKVNFGEANTVLLVGDVYIEGADGVKFSGNTMDFGVKVNGIDVAKAYGTINITVAKP